MFEEDLQSVRVYNDHRSGHTRGVREEEELDRKNEPNFAHNLGGVKLDSVGEYREQRCGESGVSKHTERREI